MEALSPKDRIIVAVDTKDLVKAYELVDELRDHVGMFKFGLEFWRNFTAMQVRGEDSQSLRERELVRKLFARLDGHYMHDEKDFDIPNTMAGAAAGTARHGPMLYTIVAAAGVTAMRAAVEKAGTSKVLAVTVPTTMTEEECIRVFGKGILEKVRDFCQDAVEAGAHGVVCAPKEAEFFLTPDRDPAVGLLDFVCPNVAPLWAPMTDQNRARSLTPGQAAKIGISRYVIGRAITNFPEKFVYAYEAADLIAEEIANALGETAL